MKFCKYLVAVSIVILITLAVTTGVFATGEVLIYIDGEELISDVAPRIINDRTMVPVRAVSEAIDCTVVWSEPEMRVDIYTPDDGLLTLSMYIDNPVVELYSLDDSGDAVIENEIIESPPVLIEDRTFVPLRIIAETLGFMVYWDEETSAVFLYSINVDVIRAAQTYTEEDAIDILYENYGITNPFCPGELNTVVEDTIFYGFYINNPDTYQYVWVNAMDGVAEFAEEIWDYTRENFGKFVDTAEMSGLELVDYLLKTIPEANEQVNVISSPLTALVTGETTTLSEGICRNVCLGTGRRTSFTPAVIYSISQDGAIYKYDSDIEAWFVVNKNPAKI